MSSIIIFLLVTYALCFLAADAKIFGCPCTAYLEDPDDLEYIRTTGILKLRQRLLKLNFFRELLQCYGCLGVWMGVAAHWILLGFGTQSPDWRSSYFLSSPWEPWPLVLGSVVAALVGAAGSFVIDTAVRRLER